MQRDAWKVVVGIVIFLGFFTFPIWYNLAYPFYYNATWAAEEERDDANLPVDDQGLWIGGLREPDIPAEAGRECIRSKAEMRTEHMEILDEWRNEVVRDGQRFRLDEDGEPLQGEHRNKSLTRTCMGCHTDRDAFCGRCHRFAGVEGNLFSEVYCWDCHVDSAVPAGRSNDDEQ